jgi:hypothetical protein
MHSTMSRSVLSEDVHSPTPASVPRRSTSLQMDRSSSARPVRSSADSSSSSSSRQRRSGSSNGNSLGGGSYHSHGSYNSRASSMVSTDELRRNRRSSTTDGKKDSSKRRSSTSSRRHHNTPSSSRASDRLTIGQSSGLGSARVYVPSSNASISSLPERGRKSNSALPDLFSLEQALTNCADDSRRIERILDHSTSTQNRNRDGSDDNGGDAGGGSSRRSERSHSLTEAPIAWKTTFEVDAPREPPTSGSGTNGSNRRPYSPSNTTTTSELIDPDPRMSDEQDAWAGIDELLETKSLDDSFTFSTMDILPCATVKAMRKDGSFRSIDVSVMNDDDDRSEYSASYEVLQRLKQMADNKKKKRFETGMMPSLIEASDQDEDSDSFRAGGGIDNQYVKQQARQDQQQQAADGPANLFSVFHWSDKQNVDELRRRKTKLNQTRKSKLDFSSPPSSQHGSDTCSLPSLDDFSTRSDISDLNSLYEKGSVVTADMRTDLRRNSIGPASKHKQTLFSIDDDTPFEISTEYPDTISLDSGSDQGSANNPPPGPLILDKQVDEYIRKIQEQLPTIAEYDGSPSKRGTMSVASYLLDGKPSPTPSSALAPDESSVWDELPSLASLSSINVSMKEEGASDGVVAGGPRRKDKKKDPTQTVSSQLIGSLKRIRSKGGNSMKPPAAKGTVQGDEQKYFPDAGKSVDETTFKPNRSLLNSDDGVNWD